MTKDRDLQDVMREERSRGRKPVDTAGEKEAKERTAALLEILQRGDRAALKKALLLYFSEEEAKEMLKRYDKLTSSDE